MASVTISPKDGSELRARTGAGTDRNLVRGNFIGTSANGAIAVPNEVGVDIAGEARMNVVGGTFNAPRSLI